MSTSQLTRMYFSYGQFMVFDRDVELPGIEWTETHTAQGFARRESSVCFRTLIEYGVATVSVCTVPPDNLDRYDRIISVPLFVSSGQISIEGPEEIDAARNINLAIGCYILTAAQSLLQDESEGIDLFFEAIRRPASSSRILKADPELTPPDELLETASVAGE